MLAFSSMIMIMAMILLLLLLNTAEPILLMVNILLLLLLSYCIPNAVLRSFHGSSLLNLCNKTLRQGLLLRTLNQPENEPIEIEVISCEILQLVRGRELESVFGAVVQE